jgi:replicative DNA helicase
MDLESRALPVSIEAEMATLGSMAMDKVALAKGIELLDASDFYRPSHQTIFNALQVIFTEEKPVDIIMLTEDLRAKGELDKVGGAEYIMSLYTQVPSASRVEHYASIVKEKSMLRKLITAGYAIASMGFEFTDADVAYEKATQTLLDIKDSAPEGFVHIKQVASELYDQLQDVMESGVKRQNIKTGLSGIDIMTCGLPDGLTVIGARPSQGKTSLLLQIARHNPVTAAMFSLETTAHALVRRLIIAKSDITSYQLRTGDIDDSQAQTVCRVINGLHSVDLHIYDKPVDITRLTAMAKRMALQYGIKALLIDYLQLIKPPKGKQTVREQEVAAVARGLKDLSQELHIPIIVAAQLKRQTDTNKKPNLQDLRESGEIEQAADLVILIHNPKPESGEDDGSERDATLIVAKQKDGPTGEVKVKWTGSKVTFSNIETRYSEPGRMPYAEERN